MDQEEGDDSGGFKRIERKFGVFSRSFRLPDNVDPENITSKVHQRCAACAKELTASAVCKDLTCSIAGRRSTLKADWQHPVTVTKQWRSSGVPSGTATCSGG